MIPTAAALDDYAERMRTLPFDEGRAHRIEWWREQAPTPPGQAFVLGFLAFFASDVVARLTCQCAMHQAKPLEVFDDTPQAEATVRRLINASRANDRETRAALVRLILDAHQGGHGRDGKEWAVEVRDRLEKIIINGHKRLGWSTW